MNAPFQARAGLRDPFRRLHLRRSDRRHAAPGRGRAWLGAREGQQGRAAQRRAVAVGLGEPEHPVRRLSESGDPLNDINALAEVCEPGTVVIAAGQVNDVRLYRDLSPAASTTIC